MDKRSGHNPLLTMQQSETPFARHNNLNAMRNGIVNALLIIGRKSGKFERQIKRELLTAIGYNSFDEFLKLEIESASLRR